VPRPPAPGIPARARSRCRRARRARDHIRGLERLGYKVTIEALSPDPETGELPVTKAS